MEVTKQRIKQLIADHLCIELDEVQDDSNFSHDLGADSLDLIEICMEIEKELIIIIPDEIAENIETVNQLYNAIESRGYKVT